MRSLLVLVLIAVVRAASASDSNVSKERAAIEATMQTACRALMKGDADLLGTVISRSPELRIIDPQRLTKGFAEFDAGVREWFKTSKVTRAAYNDVNIRLSRSGDIAWYTGTLRLEGSSAQGPFNWTIREIGVLEKHDGQWVYAAWAEYHDEQSAGSN